MSKCSKVKNPCKICLNPVNQKNGLQCQGICSSWVHFNCLNYSPGRIKDIKSGHLRVNCPCPDCLTSEGKEFYTHEGYTCEDQSCPARLPPACGKPDCVVETVQKNVSRITTGTGTNCSETIICAEPNFRSPVLPGRRHSMEDVGDIGKNRELQNLTAEINKVIATMGQLTQQFNTMMSKLKEAMDQSKSDGSVGTTCSKQGPSNLCPKPCYCNEPKGKKK
ncbi:uncharacterized protein LOC128680472 isoform X2 [Plodia interpunctella]|uniref:uncharacterized protein LOC128680472 isoform X2 n=1 Tax=Plodia interpunctella TaxID=58824 RepID=UPI00236869D8|nr:uncharacterized protein LOC128680472 isoform X2 [Plodia interpunctella]XP_053619639.1 uncharacterized protein LOC128680472 isoform X2 [Plodia interpunctella]